MATEQPVIRVELVDETHTWVTVVPINVDSWVPGHPNFNSVERAVGEAFATFFGSLIRDQVAVEEHLENYGSR